MSSPCRSAPGRHLRYDLDRESETFKTIYKQRTADERINSLALELGIERPKLRNRQAITNQNTLIYVLLNLPRHPRVQAKQAELARQTTGGDGPAQSRKRPARARAGAPRPLTHHGRAGGAGDRRQRGPRRGA